MKEMSRNYRYVKFVNLSMSSLGVFSNKCSTFLDMVNDIGIDKKQQQYIIKKHKYSEMMWKMNYFIYFTSFHSSREIWTQ